MILIPLVQGYETWRVYAEVVTNNNDYTDVCTVCVSVYIIVHTLDCTLVVDCGLSAMMRHHK